MSYQEKKTLVSVSSGVILLAVYCLTILTQYNSQLNANDLKFWATSILLFIGLSIMIQIIIQIVFHIFLSASIAIENKTDNEKEIEKEIKLEMVEDERDHIIELKALRVGYMVAGIGFMFGLFSTVFSSSVAIMLNIMFLSFMVGSIIEGIAQYYYYKRGI